MKLNKDIVGYIAPYDINTAIIKNDILVQSRIKHFYVLKGREGAGSEYYLSKEIVETWEPVYEEGFKVGDFVYCSKSKGATDYREKRHSPVFKIKEISHQEENTWLRPVKGESTGVCLTKDVRLATPEEIKAAQTKTFDMGEFEVIVEDGRCYHQTEDISNFVKVLCSSINCEGYLISIKNATFSKTGCENSETTLSQWREVYDEMQKGKALKEYTAFNDFE